MSSNPLHGRCPCFPAAFNICSPGDLLRCLPAASVTLFFRKTKLNSGHYTLMWTMSKLMLKIAQGRGLLELELEGVERESGLAGLVERYVHGKW